MYVSVWQIGRLAILTFSLFALLSLGCSSSGSGSSSVATPNRPNAPASSPVASSPVASNPAASGGGQVSNKQWNTEPAMSIDPNKRYTAKISTTLGDMEAELFPKDAPKTVNNFVFLAREGYYENVKFHRVIKDFMIQGGDPTGTGAGGPGYKFVDELQNPLTYEIGTLAMANAGPNTNGSQFFIVHGSAGTSLPKQYSIFGKLTSGQDVLDKIATTPVRNQSSPVTDVLITSVTITEQ
jgi:cyclophilin family peptidyl-prolyl cis-trans isomerase